MLVNFDTVASYTMGIATFVAHIGDSSQNFLQSGKQAIYTLVQILILMHVVKRLHLSVQLTDIAARCWSLVFLFDNIEENFFQQCSALGNGTVIVSFRNIFHCTTRENHDIVPVNSFYLRSLYSNCCTYCLYHEPIPYTNQFVTTEIQFAIDSANGSINDCLVGRVNLICGATSEDMNKLFFGKKETQQIRYPIISDTMYEKVVKIYPTTLCTTVSTIVDGQTKFV